MAGGGRPHLTLQVVNSLDGVPGLHDVLRTLADGRLRELAAAVEVLRGRDPLLADIAEADAGARVGAVAVADLLDLQRRVAEAAPERPLLRWWVLAVLGERAFLDTDLGVIPLAVQALLEMPDEPFAPLPVLYVRGRLHRIAGAVYLVAPGPASLAEHLRQRDLAVADFLRAGMTAEVALTRGLSAAIHAISTWDDVLEDLEIVRDARALLGDAEESVWLPVLDQLHALVALTAGELDEAGAAIAAVERRRGAHPVIAAFAEMSRTEHTLLVTGGADTAVKAVTAALDRLRAGHPHLLGLSQLRIANVLADLARTGEARSVGLAGLGWPPTNPTMAVAGALLRVRLDVLDGLPRSADDALGLLEELVQLGNVRRAGALALRMSHDFDRIGATADAAALRRWGLERLPPPPRRTAWERRWSAPAGSGPMTPLPAGTVPLAGAGRPGPATGEPATGEAVTVRVMRPVLEVEVGGAPVTLRTMPAKLLLALLVAFPEPLHVEQAVDLLWPDAAPDVGRPRLNTVVHRLRTALQLGPGTLRRVGDVLLLSPAGWDVDLFAHRAALRSADAAQLDALARPPGNLCHVQFPYDEWFVEQRHLLEGETASARRRAAEGSA